MISTDPTDGSLPTPTYHQWQPPLPTMSPPPLPTSASMPITSTTTSTTVPYVGQSDQIFNDSTVRLINFNDPYSTPPINRTPGQPAPWSTPSYSQVQPAFPSTPTGSPWAGGGSQSASPYQATTLTIDPTDYILAGLHTSLDSMSQASSTHRQIQFGRSAPTLSVSPFATSAQRLHTGRRS